MNYTAPIFIAPATVDSLISVSADSKSIVNFYEVMQLELLSNYVDPDGVISYKGIEVSGSDKFGLLGTTLISQAMTDQKNIIETVMSIETNLYDLEKEAGRMLGG